MKLKLAIVSLIMLGSTACVTSTNSYTRDIVYRDGSYYSPADDQNGDYYYEPEPDYSYYDSYDAYYGFSSGFYGNPWYGYNDAYRCRFSYYHDRYCNSGWGNFFLNIGGISLIFGNSNYYDYGYGYGYGYPYSGYYGHYSPRPRPANGPIPVAKPVRRGIPTPDYSVNNNPGIRVPGEPVRIPTKPGLLEQDTTEPVVEPDAVVDANPYTRTRQPRQNLRPENWRDRDNANAGADDGILIRNREPARRQAKPLPVIDSDSDPQAYEKPVRQPRRPQPYPVNTQDNRGPGQVLAQDAQTRERPERAARIERSQRPERTERVERVERSAPAVRQEKRSDGKDER